MNEAPSSLKTGWITFWIALGVLMIVLFVAFPLALTYKARAEYTRYQGCVNRTETNCNPSLAWVLNGWSLTSAATSTSATTPVMDSSTSSTCTFPSWVRTAAIVTPPKTLSIGGMQINNLNQDYTFTAGQWPLISLDNKDSKTKLSLKATLELASSTAISAEPFKEIVEGQGTSRIYNAELRIPENAKCQTGVIRIVETKKTSTSLNIVVPVVIQ